MSARAAILGRIRTALARPSDEPHWLHEPRGTGPLFPLPANEPAALAERFAQELAPLLGEFVPLDSPAAAAAWFAKDFAERGVRRALAPEHPLLRQALEGVPGVEWVAPDGPARKGWEHADAGVTPALALVAESGTVAVPANLAGRLLSVLPPAHYVVATRGQLTPDLDSAFARLRWSGTLPSAVSFISGPSRTADIEKILVLGAHGPRRFVLLLLPG